MLISRLYTMAMVLIATMASAAPTRTPSYAEWEAVHTLYQHTHTAQLSSYQWLPAQGRNDVPREQLFAQRINVAPGTQIYAFGDLHGDYAALDASLSALKTANVLSATDEVAPDSLLLFLGDYVDRGAYGIEIVHKLKLLAAKNPSRIVLVRGNHEDIAINGPRYGGTFITEITDKFPARTQQVIQQCAAFYDTLPIVVYLDNGSSAIQGCHGWMEIGYNPTKLLSAPGTTTTCEPVTLARGNEYAQLNGRGIPLHVDVHSSSTRSHLTKNKHISCENGFMWADCTPDPTAATRYNRYRGELQYGKQTTMMLMKHQAAAQRPIVGLVRGHQHNDSLPTIFDKSRHGTTNVWEQPYFTTITTPIMLGLSKYQQAACTRIVATTTGWEMTPLYVPTGTKPTLVANGTMVIKR